MRIVVVAVGIIMAGAAAWLIVTQAAGGSRSYPPLGAQQPAVATASAGVTTSATPDPARFTTRGALLNSAKSVAEMEGGTNLVAEQVARVPVRALAERLGWTQKDAYAVTDGTGMTPETMVHVVQLRGVFRPSSQPGAAPLGPRSALFTVVFDGAGDWIHTRLEEVGYRP